jgi:hypothetical protein
LPRQNREQSRLGNKKQGLPGVWFYGFWFYGFLWFFDNPKSPVYGFLKTDSFVIFMVLWFFKVFYGFLWFFMVLLGPLCKALPSKLKVISA